MRTVGARDGTRLVVHERGSRDPLLCVPGGPGRASDYLEGLGGLDEDRTLLLADTRGSGASELPDDRDSLAFPRLADDVEDLRAGLGLDPFDVLAHSAGCPIALLHAAAHPGAVRTLVLVTPSGLPFGIAPRDLEAIRASRSAEPWYGEAAEAAALAETADPRLRRDLDRAMRPFWYGRWDDRTQAHAASADRQVSLRAAAGYVPRADYDPAAARAALATISARVLIVTGERDALTGVAVAPALAEHLKGAETTVAVVPDAGHFPWVDEPDSFRAVVRDFLLPSA